MCFGALIFERRAEKTEFGLEGVELGSGGNLGLLE
jgi:hypothetical protein